MSLSLDGCLPVGATEEQILCTGLVLEVFLRNLIVRVVIAVNLNIIRELKARGRIVVLEESVVVVERGGESIG